jgi:uncharacterized membrane protein
MDSNPYAPPRAAVLEAEDGERDLILEGRKLSASRGKAWFGEAWTIFRLSPGKWVLLSLLFFLLTFVMGLVPGGSLITSILLPAFIAGLMLGARDVEAGQPLTMGYLFRGFQHNAGNLILDGLLYLAMVIGVTIASMIPMFAIIPFIATSVPTGGAPDLAGFASAFLPLMALFLAIFLLLYLPVLAAFWYSSALIVFHNVGPLEAMKASFRGVVRNIVPQFVYSAVALGIFLLALIPLGLGLLVAMPLLWITMYTGYRDIFLRPGANP